MFPSIHISSFDLSCPSPFDFAANARIQALSIDPINGCVLELLEMALEASADMGPFGWKGPPGGEENWEKQMREHRDKGKQVAKAMSPGEEFEDASL